MITGEWRVTVPPTIEPLTLAEAKAQCRVDASMTDEDALIGSYIAGAREICEGMDWRAYLTQTIELWLTGWPADGKIELPRPPLQSVSSIVYYDTTDAAATLATAAYFVDTVSQPGRVRLRSGQSWPSVALRDYNAICVTYVAGWSTAALVPEKIKQAMRLIIGHWYENREETTVGAVSRAIEMGVRSLLTIDQRKQF